MLRGLFSLDFTDPSTLISSHHVIILSQNHVAGPLHSDSSLGKPFEWYPYQWTPRKTWFQHHRQPKLFTECSLTSSCGETDCGCQFPVLLYRIFVHAWLRWESFVIITEILPLTSNSADRLPALQTYSQTKSFKTSKISPGHTRSSAPAARPKTVPFGCKTKLQP